MITSSAYSPTHTAAIALAFVRTAQAASGTTVSVIVPGEDRPVTATICDLPFRDPTP
jgi:glycine cleavage system aminomethyltransferase T